MYEIYLYTLHTVMAFIFLQPSDMKSDIFQTFFCIFILRKGKMSRKVFLSDISTPFAVFSRLNYSIFRTFNTLHKQCAIYVSVCRQITYFSFIEPRAIYLSLQCDVSIIFFAPNKHTFHPLLIKQK